MRIKSSLIRPTVRRRKTKGNRKTVQPLVLVLKGEKRRRKVNVLRAFSPVSKRGRKRTKENVRKGAQKRYECFRRSHERAKTVEIERNKHPRRVGKGVNLAVGPMVRELSSRLVWKQESTR